MFAELAKLEELYQAGFVQDYEYETRKAELLSQLSQTSEPQRQGVRVSQSQALRYDIWNQCFLHEKEAGGSSQTLLGTECNEILYYMALQNESGKELEIEEMQEEEEEKEKEEEEEYYPHSYRFDYTELLQLGKVPSYGEKWIVTINSGGDLDATIMKSDSATVSIPEVELENAAGLARYTSVRDLIAEGRENMEKNLSYYSGTLRDKFNLVVEKMQQMENGTMSCSLILEDPLANSFVTGLDPSQIQRQRYTRTWDEDFEYGLAKEVPDNFYETDAAVEIIVDLIRKAHKIVAFSGAGVSTESGIPAYRTPGATNNIWDKFNPEDENLNRFLTDADSRKRYWQMHAHFYPTIKSAKPNPSHIIFFYLQQLGKLSGIITQNIDGLHEAAGVFKDKIVELHGTSKQIRCMNCPQLYDPDPIFENVSNGSDLSPTCKVCGGFLKPNTISFGQALDPSVHIKALQLVEECDLLIVLGSSLVVQPANRIPGIVIQRGLPVVLVNRGETKYDNYVTLRIDDNCGEVMQKVLSSLASS